MVAVDDGGGAADDDDRVCSVICRDISMAVAEVLVACCEVGAADNLGMLTDAVAL